MVSTTTILAVLAYNGKHEFTAKDILAVVGILIISIILNIVIEILKKKE